MLHSKKESSWWCFEYVVICGFGWVVTQKGVNRSPLSVCTVNTMVHQLQMIQTQQKQQWSMFTICVCSVSVSMVSSAALT